MASSIFPRGNGGTCVLCKRKFERGNRVEIVHIVETVGANPSNPREVGSWLSGDFELKHVNCADTGLDATIIIGSHS